ncbi:hypothetical protein [Prosthecobacter debontii]|uniref:hypothetical protein n=1 Tax=Prosthecobacter debontii TaxID=48467 RepID=UPI0011166386|nr:hypothetical protein [Prosthecobacter debontii]
MRAIIQHFQEELTPEERVRFQALAARHARTPGQHLKCLLFGPSAPAALAKVNPNPSTRPGRVRQRGEVSLNGTR